MPLFNDMLGADESLFKNEIALDYDFLPKMLPYREEQQKQIAYCIKPLMQGRIGKNLFIYGAPGIGKTAAIKSVLRELEEETDEVVSLYINCWQKNTTFKILYEICDMLDLKFIQNKRTDELWKMIKLILNKKPVVFAFDEIDKVEDYDFLYMILEEIYNKSVFIITNYGSWLDGLDSRIKSWLAAGLIEFKPYSQKETYVILKERAGYALVPGVLEDDALNLIAKKGYEMEDMRVALHLMRMSTEEAEKQSSKKVTVKHVESALANMDSIAIKEEEELSDDERLIFEIVKDNSGSKIGELFELYQKKGGKGTYKTFQRRISRLSEGRFVNVEKTEGGKGGNTTIVRAENIKKLTEF